MSSSATNRGALQLRQPDATPLEESVARFRARLTPEQQADLTRIATTPGPNSVLQFTAEIDRRNTGKQSRCVAARVQTVLQSVQQFCGVVDTFVSSNPKIAALVWGTFKLSLLAGLEVASTVETC